ncbi:MAG: hypothetical protein ABIV94_11775 [Acidimicrobiales bacterium]
MSANTRQGDRGQIALLVVVVIVVLLAVIMLQRTLNNANSINAKAERIATSGRGINISTDSIVQLDKTVGYAQSILKTAQPLEKQLNSVIGLGDSINAHALSIGNSATTINGTAKTIAGSGSSINGSASGIANQLGQVVDIAESIRKGVAQIDINADGTIGLAQAIRGDTTNIANQASSAARNGSCIDKSLAGASTDCN